MSEWDALECPLNEAPLFYIEPKDRDPASEHERQVQVVVRCRRMGLECDAVPNARKWGQKAWNMAKREGVRWGHADLIITGHGAFTAFCEMKDGTAPVPQHQIDFLNSKVRQGHHAAVCRTADGVEAWLREAGAPIREAA